MKPDDLWISQKQQLLLDFRHSRMRSDILMRAVPGLWESIATVKSAHESMRTTPQEWMDERDQNGRSPIFLAAAAGLALILVRQTCALNGGEQREKPRLYGRTRCCRRRHLRFGRRRRRRRT